MNAAVKEIKGDRSHRDALESSKCSFFNLTRVLCD